DRQLVAEVEDQVTGDGDGGEEAEELPAPPLVPPQARGGDSALRTGSRERGEVEYHADEQHRAPCRDEPRCRVRGGRALGTDQPHQEENGGGHIGAESNVYESSRHRFRLVAERTPRRQHSERSSSGRLAGRER